MLTREEVLQKRPISLVEVNIPELGGSVHVAAPTASEFEKFLAWRAQLKEAGNDDKNVRARIAVLACRNPDGSLMFTRADEGALSELPVGVLIRIDNALNKLISLDDAEMEVRAKNSPTTPGGDSNTD